MGAWSVEVLTNDRALDKMYDVVRSQNLKATVTDIFQGDQDIDELLLAVEIVDISLNGVDEDILGGFYNYEEWFANVEKMEMEDLKPDAIRAIQYIQEEENRLQRWFPRFWKDRKQLLKKIEKRLLSENQ